SPLIRSRIPSSAPARDRGFAPSKMSCRKQAWSRPCAGRAARTSTPRAGSSPDECRTRPGGERIVSMPSPLPRLGMSLTLRTMFAASCRRALLAAIALALGSGCTTKQTVQESPQIVPLPAPQPASPQIRAQLHTDLGAGYYERGQMDVALEELSMAVRIDPTYAPAYNIFGLVYAVLGDDRKAEQSFAQALQLAPNDSDIRHNWGWYLCQHGREHDALVEFETAVRNPLYRTPEVALVNAGRCSQPYDERAAENYYRRALAAQPGNPLASLGLAQIAY